MSDYTKDIQAALTELKGLSDELKGVPEEYKGLKAKAEETEQKMAELAATVEIAMKRGELGGGNAADVLDSAEMKALSSYMKKGAPAQELVGPSGGYLVVPTLAQRIIDLQTDSDVFRPYANSIRIGTNLAQVPVETGKPTTAWVGEVETRGETDNVALGLGNIPVNTVQATVKISRDLLQDAAVVNFEQYVMGRIADALSDAEGAAFVAGSGFKQPEGLYSCDKISNITTGTALTVKADDLIDMWGETTQATDANAAYYVSKKLAVAMRKFKDTTNQYLWNPALSQGMDPTYNGFPVRILKSAPNTITTANAVVAMFGDLKNTYTIVDRMDMDILRDEYTGAANNTVIFRVNKRVGGGVVQPASMVGLKVKAS